MTKQMDALNNLRVSRGSVGGEDAIVLEVQGRTIADNRLWVDVYPDIAAARENSGQLRCWLLSGNRIKDGRLYVVGKTRQVFLRMSAIDLMDDVREFTISLLVERQGKSRVFAERLRWRLDSANEGGAEARLYDSHARLSYPSTKGRA